MLLIMASICTIATRRLGAACTTCTFDLDCGAEEYCDYKYDEANELVSTCCAPYDTCTAPCADVTECSAGETCAAGCCEVDDSCTVCQNDGDCPGESCLQGCCGDLDEGIECTACQNDADCDGAGDACYNGCCAYCREFFGSLW